MSYLERRRNLWYAVLTVPEDAREKLGRLRFVQSLGTSIKSVAEREAAPLVAKWKALIAQARGQTDALTEEALRWRRHLGMQESGAASGNQLYANGLDVLQDQLYDRAIELEEFKGAEVGRKLRSIALGTARLSNEYFEAWKAQLDVAAKTKDQAVKDVSLMLKRFSTLEEITKSNVKKWMDEISSSGKGLPSQQRVLSFCRSYWKYLQSHDVISIDLDPFHGVLNVSKAKRKGKSTEPSNLPYAPSDVIKIWKAAKERRYGKGKNAPLDIQLQSVIKLGAYTGARIEELCSLRVADVTETAFRITDSKTTAGIREVPIHSAIADFVASLVESSEDGYLVSGLTFNKYEDRSNAVGKRFGRLKTKLGFGDDHTFHSWRSTVITRLENAGIGENLAADIVGHEKPRITYGLYSGGASLEVKRAALEKVHYPEPLE